MKKSPGFWLWLLPVLLFVFPVSYLVTVFIHPFWSWFEKTWGIEAMGHSGPSDWCFWSVYGLFSILIVIFWAWLAAQKNSAAGTDTPRLPE